ncbi:MerR family transcriptional regulator [Streptomyces xantholiticus]|uniref:MerR family transcriptional regulator n=1 Tax=Streptomyces xantholiticus TaxID=68285 RepID=UPI001672E154|nr:MerR family transcriptional regulator [Streptomyces xantholiticus]GGW58121.1 transcriptional regulator [Streptomyces xantholiticus]
MRLAELSEQSGVSIATIKYYLRERLLPPGRRVTATQAEYDEAHLRRLRLVRAMIQVGGMPVATAREVLAHIDDESLGLTMRLGAATWALPQPPEAPLDDAASTDARQEVERLLEELGWDSVREVGDLSPVYRSLITSIATLNGLGYTVSAAELLPYARQMEQIAIHDMDQLENLPEGTEQVEAAVAAQVLYDPLLLSLRRLALEAETTRRYGMA